jgi:STE24 endopeptidase
MGNAAVMGLIPQVRYILMSDLLLETMTDEQIEAVFAHEVGHIIHRHMLWFAVFFGTMMFALVGLSQPLDNLTQRFSPQAIWPSAVATLAASLGCLSVFLFLSRKFERQADVFAARTIQGDAPPTHTSPAPQDVGPHVGLHGAAVFTSALHQVARINCIPLTAWSWCHGSIAKRIDYLHDLSHDPARTQEFDRFMSRLRLVLMIALCAFGVWAMVALAGQQGQ